MRSALRSTASPACLDLLKATKLDPRRSELARIAQSSADALLSQINDILDFSKIEAGKLELESVRFDLRLLLEDVAEMFVCRANEKGVELACHVSPELPTNVLGDPERVRQVIINLVNNAMKFTAQGEVAIRASLVSHQADDRGCLATVRVSVRNTGIGISAEQQRRLFSSFSQVDASITRKYGGTGLGLAICKQLVALMQGRIGVESQAGKGSTFWCELPLFVVEDSSVSDRVVPGDLAALRVLAVDDTPTNLEILHDQLQSWGFEFVAATDANMGLSVMRAEAEAGRPFQLAILDQQLPDMDGLELAAAIKADPLLRDIPLLMLTSLGDNLEPQEASRLGMSGILTKPIRQSRLFDSIVHAIRRVPVRNTLCAMPSGGASQLTGWRSGARVLIADDNEINRLVTGEMLASEGYSYDLATNGREAIKALHEHRYDAVLMDCQMPEMDGFEATREIRRLESEGSLNSSAHGRVAIIALTANAVRGDREKCLAADMDDYVTKPIDRGQLLATLDAHVRPRMAELESAPVASLGIDQEVACPTVGGTASICVEGLLERCQGDWGFAAKMLRKFQARTPGEVAEIKRALVARDAHTAGHLATPCAGAAGMLSIVHLQQLAGQIETLASEQQITGTLDCMVGLEEETHRVFDQLEQMLNQSENSP